MIPNLQNREWKKAAVLVLCYAHENEEHVLLTRRSEIVEHHKGQICFPGGAQDPEDRDLWDTALREGQEEIGLDPQKVTLIKELSPQITPSGFLVTPFVAKLEAPQVWKPSEIEIAEIFSVPFTHLKNPQNVRFERKNWEGHEIIDPHFLYHHHDIWGMTGRVICDLLEMQQSVFF